MGFESSLGGGDRNPHEARQSGEVRKERKEANYDFAQMKRTFQKQAHKIFTGTERADFMTALRSDIAFQNLKTDEGFNSKSRMIPLTEKFEEYLKKELSIEDPDQQVALIANLVQLDYLQDQQMIDEAA